MIEDNSLLENNDKIAYCKIICKKGNLDVSKASQNSDTRAKIIKMNADIFAEVLYNVLNRLLEVGQFSSGMKLANVTPVH